MTQLRSVTSRMGYHTVLLATRHKWTHPTLIPAIQAGTRFTYPGGMEGWVDLVDLIALRPGVELATFQSRIQRSTTKTMKRYRLMELYNTINILSWKQTSKAQLSLWKSAAAISNTRVESTDLVYPCRCPSVLAYSCTGLLITSLEACWNFHYNAVQWTASTVRINFTLQNMKDGVSIRWQRPSFS